MSYNHTCKKLNWHLAKNINFSVRFIIFIRRPAQMRRMIILILYVQGTQKVCEHFNKARANASCSFSNTLYIANRTGSVVPSRAEILTWKLLLIESREITVQITRVRSVQEMAQRNKKSLLFFSRLHFYSQGVNRDKSSRNTK